MTKINNLPMILIILDGWGIAEPSRGNAVTLAKTLIMDKLVRKYSNTTLCAHGKYVGLSHEQAGNSEAGHVNIGAGRLVEQDALKISKSINTGTFFKNAAFKEAILNVKKRKSRLHLMGILSNGKSPHSDPDHILALVILAQQHGIKNVYLHLFTDGRDSPQYVSWRLIHDIELRYPKIKCFATIMGRFYAMDRKKKWERTEQAYNALVLGTGRKAKDALIAISRAYNRRKSDEFIEPCVITKNGKSTPRINDGDSIIYFNLRSDRARQLSKVFVQKKFNEMNPGSFRRKKMLKDITFIAMTDFGPDLGNILTAYPSEDLHKTLPMQLAGLRQLYIAEIEKYAHVTYFFNGGYAGAVAGEDKFMIPSPDVKSYDSTPAMSSEKLTAVVIKNLRRRKHDFTVLNFAAPDMIGHTGNLQAGIECCSKVDKYLGNIIKAYLKVNGTVIVTADHGNVEEMINLETGEVNTEHSTNPVPFIVINKKLKNIKLRKGGILGDVAPTILDLMGLAKPKEMTGRSLLMGKKI